jgi:hypothetical protein
MKVGQKHQEQTTLRWTPFGLFVTNWNVSVPAIVAGDHKQEWRFFGVRFRAKEFGIMLRIRS